MLKNASFENIGKWGLNTGENISVSDFNNVTDIEQFGIFPGEFEGDSENFLVNENPEPLNKIPYNEGDYAYSYIGDGYFYGITNQNTEIIGIIEQDKTVIPILSSPGKYVANYFPVPNRNEEVLNIGKMIDFTVNDGGEYPSVTVRYEISGSFKYAESSNTYTFKERCMSADVKLYCLEIEGLTRSCMRREVLNQYEKSTRRLFYDWQYPENNDFSYKHAKTLSYCEKYGDYMFFTAVRDENTNYQYEMKRETAESIAMHLPSKEKEFSYTTHIDYAVAPANEKNKYAGYFKTKNDEFAAGIACLNERDNSTVFYGKDIHLNINVTNVTDGDINFSARYELLDNDGNIITSKISYNNILHMGEEANHNIKMSLPLYGMYYLNLYVKSQNSEYRETYPFCCIEEYDFKYRDENPFGLCATHTDTIGQARTAAKICGKIGLSIIRPGSAVEPEKSLQFYKENGVKRHTKGLPWVRYKDAAGVEKLINAAKDVPEEYWTNDSVPYFLMANEIDAPAKGNYDKSYKLLTEDYIPHTFKPLYEYLSENHPEGLKKIIWQSNCHATTEWLEAFHDTGMWDASEFIDIHTYSSPSGPDKVFANSRYSMHANTFSNEYAMDRWKRLVKRYGNKRMIVGETGYPSAPYIGNRCENDPKTVADFNVRIACFLLEAGAEDIIYYCIFDRTSYYSGTGKWNEMYFGACYNYNQYGVYQPKPWTPAYANLTRRFDGVEKVTFFDKYEEKEFGTLRAFKVKTKENEFAVLWSNIYKQPNTTVEGRVDKVERIPMPLWGNRWVENETREFDTVGDTVKVVDVMGNETVINAENGKVKLNISGSPIYVYGIK